MRSCENVDQLNYCVTDYKICVLISEQEREREKYYVTLIINLG